MPWGNSRARKVPDRSSAIPACGVASGSETPRPRGHVSRVGVLRRGQGSFGELTFARGCALLDSWPIRRSLVLHRSLEVRVMRPRSDLFRRRSVFVLEVTREPTAFALASTPLSVSRRLSSPLDSTWWGAGQRSACCLGPRSDRHVSPLLWAGRSRLCLAGSHRVSYGIDHRRFLRQKGCRTRREPSDLTAANAA
jgi:hypothetical protein